MYGPNSDLTDNDWYDVVSGSTSDARLITHSFNPKATNVNDGYYSWPWADKNNPNDDHAARMEYFYRYYMSDQPEMAKIGAIYPGFKAFYDQGYDNGEVFFEIDYDHGKTLDQMVSMALQYEDQVEMHQLVTWNDFGEGTMFEPTREFGFQFLISLNPLTGGSTNFDDYHAVLDKFIYGRSDCLKLNSL